MPHLLLYPYTAVETMNSATICAGVRASLSVKDESTDLTCMCFREVPRKFMLIRIFREFSHHNRLGMVSSAGTWCARH